MDRSLNLSLVTETMSAKGLTQTALAAKLGLTKAAVSKWIKGDAFPRPPELLKLGKALGLGHAELVAPLAPSPLEPVVAFRKRAGTKTTPEHVAHAREMGRLLAPVVKHLPFDRFLSAPRLKNPVLDYGYLQSLVGELRRDLKLSPDGPIKFTDLIGKFAELQAVIVPVLWGQKTRHENALHIYLPESDTTWIYLNLDSHLHDFKFWMAHELGHVLAVDLLKADTMEEAEDFSDAFAGALLYPEAAAKPAYAQYAACSTEAQRLRLVVAQASRHVISPNSVHKEIQHHAEAKGLPFAPIAKDTLFPAIAKFNRTYPSVSEHLFDGQKPSADHFMRVCAENFKTPIFAALSAYLKATPQSDAVVSRILDVPLTDAKELRQALA